MSEVFNRVQNENAGMKDAIENPMQLAKIVQEYVVARLDGMDDLADRIWRANPDLQDRMVVAIKEEKGER